MKYNICKITDGLGNSWYQIREEHKTFFSTNHNWLSFDKHRLYPPAAKFESEQIARDSLKKYLKQQEENRLKETQSVEVISTYEQV